ncbi:MAG: hypothetical protein GC184_15090 [Rhizobiales bacterium]|nr:hypothetical protein [Hyphomicrobiales bacterium]
MKPDVEVVMQGFMGTLFTDIAPHLTAEYAVGHVSLMALMLFMTAHEHEHGAEFEMTDIQEMQAIFADATGKVADTALKARLAEAAKADVPSLQLSKLRAQGDLYRSLLIELHEWAEAHNAHLEGVILDHLLDAANRRKLTMPSLG